LVGQNVGIGRVCVRDGSGLERKYGENEGRGWDRGGGFSEKGAGWLRVGGLGWSEVEACMVVNERGWSGRRKAEIGGG